jgi:hypothetical protein
MAMVLTDSALYRVVFLPAEKIAFPMLDSACGPPLDNLPGVILVWLLLLLLRKAVVTMGLTSGLTADGYS